jgi:hypothetical protein
VRGVSEVDGTELMFIGNSAMLTIQGAMSGVLRGAARPVPGLSEALETVLLRTGDPGGRSVLGQFRPERWDTAGPVRLHEILIADRRLDAGAEGVAETLLHELAHLLAEVRGLDDTSNRGRYHNGRYKLCAHDIRLVVRYGKPFGYLTCGLSQELRVRLADELRDLHRALVLKLAIPWEVPNPIDAGHALVDVTMPARRTFIFAICGCVNARGRYQPVRVAVGRWRQRSIFCASCGVWFRDPEESLTTAGQGEDALTTEVPATAVRREITRGKGGSSLVP